MTKLAAHPFKLSPHWMEPESWASRKDNCRSLHFVVLRTTSVGMTAEVVVWRRSGRDDSSIRNGTLRMKDPIAGFEKLYFFAVVFAAEATPACSASLAALSVASQVNSGSVRPKWP